VVPTRLLVPVVLPTARRLLKMYSIFTLADFTDEISRIYVTVYMQILFVRGLSVVSVRG
jgi:hypothetical protein